MTPRSRLLVVLALFFASGAAGLIYEVVWMRLLALTLSVTVYAVTTVLCAFMAGLALGAAAAGRIAHRLARPLVVYGVAEIGIGIAGLATPGILFHLAPAYVWVHDRLGASPFAFTAARFVLAFVVLLVPCTLMGATLPLLSRATIVRHETVGRGAGALYAVNTFGAVLGVVAAGFFLLPRFGLWATSAVAAAFNIAIGIAAIALGARERIGADAAPGQPAIAMPWTVRAVCLVFAASGFTALGYEVLWTRALEQFTHNSTYAYSAMLATFLLGLALGSLVAARGVDRLRNPLLVLGLVQVLIAVSVLGGLVVYARFDRLVPAIVGTLGGIASWPRVVTLIFGEAAVVLFLTTLLFGATFPLVARIVVERVALVSERIAAAYVANTIGSIAGAVVVGFVLLPAFGMRGGFVALVLVNLTLGVLIAMSADRRAAGLGIAGLAVAAGLVAIALVPHGLFEHTYLRRFGKLLFYREEVTDTVMVTEDVRGARMIRFGDGRGTAGTMSVRDDRMYAHIPLVLHPEPRRVLNICFGVGNSLSAVLAHPIERVDAVELSPGVVDAAPFFRSTNHDPLADPRVALTIADGRNYLLATHETYDVIRLDPPELHTAGVVNLYTREFYELARAHLRARGIFSIWVNIVMTPEPDLQLLVRTVASVFPHVSVWRGPLRYSWVINGSDSPLGPDLGIVLRHYAEPAVRADLTSIGVPDAYAFLTHFVLATEGAARFAGIGPLVTDDHTRLDFSVPRSIDSLYGFSNANAGNWLVEFMGPEVERDMGARVFFRKIVQLDAHKEPVLPHLINVEGSGLSIEELRARLAAAAAPTAAAPVAPPDAAADRRS